VGVMLKRKKYQPKKEISKMGKILGAVATKIFSQKILIAILLKLGDWLVLRSENNLDDKIWIEVKKAFNESNG
tara:strand:- start:378 stop:596 length:219 start_codon:yes stop_codon:yes gene_type:complete